MTIDLQIKNCVQSKDKIQNWTIRSFDKTSEIIRAYLIETSRHRKNYLRSFNMPQRFYLIVRFLRIQRMLLHSNFTGSPKIENICGFLMEWIICWDKKTLWDFKIIISIQTEWKWESTKLKEVIELPNSMVTRHCQKITQLRRRSTLHGKGWPW